MKNIALVIEDDIDLSEIFTKALDAAGLTWKPFRMGRSLSSA